MTASVECASVVVGLCADGSPSKSSHVDININLGICPAVHVGDSGEGQHLTTRCDVVDAVLVLSGNQIVDDINVECFGLACLLCGHRARIVSSIDGIEGIIDGLVLLVGK